jgi:hypothetical protein
MKPVIMLALLTALLISSNLSGTESPSITQTELVRRTQQLLDAFAPGDRTPWKLYLADDAMFFDEKGRAMDKVAFLADLQPLPAGYSGSIKITGTTARFAAGVAIQSYDCDETETVFGQVMHARYHMTDTWVYRNSLWQILASQTLRYYEDPVAATVAESLLNDYIGTYVLAPGQTVIVSRQGARLYAQRGSGKVTELLPESPDLFFRAGVEGRWLFHRDSARRVDLLIDRRNNEDLVWKKTE